MFKLPISATTLALVCLCLSVLSAHAQQYFVDDGETVQPVYNLRQTRQTDIQATVSNPPMTPRPPFSLDYRRTPSPLLSAALMAPGIALLEIYNLESPLRAVS